MLRHALWQLLVHEISLVELYALICLTYDPMTRAFFFVRRTLMFLDMLANTSDSSRLGCTRSLTELPFNSANRYLDWLLTAPSRLQFTGVPFNDAIASD